METSRRQTLAALGSAALLGWPRGAAAWTIRGPGGAATTRSVAALDVFRPESPAWSGAVVRTDPLALARAAAEALRWLETRPADVVCQPGLFADLGHEASLQRRTLARLVELAGLPEGAARLADPGYLLDHFDFLRWWPDRVGAAARGLKLPEGKIRLTRYFVPQVQGRSAWESAFPVALYADPGEAVRTRYTRAEVFGGVFRDGGAAAGQARPLVWLSTANAHDAMMQGTVEVALPDGTTQLLNVHRPNGWPYRPGVRSEAQERLWYFRVVEGVLGWGDSGDAGGDQAGDKGGDKVGLAFGASVAGDLHNLGLGRLLVLEHAGALRLVVLGDTGGAFQPNLFQLDWLAGAFPSRTELAAATRELPDHVAAGVLVAR